MNVGGRTMLSVTEMASLVLFAADVDKAAEFYRAIGLELENEHHDEGPVHFAAELGLVHFAVCTTGTTARPRFPS